MINNYPFVSKVIHEDIEAIQFTIRKLETFNNAYQKIVGSFNELMDKLKLFSPSAITSEDVDKKKAEFDVKPHPFPSLQNH